MTATDRLPGNRDCQGSLFCSIQPTSHYAATLDHHPPSVQPSNSNIIWDTFSLVGQYEVNPGATYLTPHASAFKFCHVRHSVVEPHEAYAEQQAISGERIVGHTRLECAQAPFYEAAAVCQWGSSCSGMVMLPG